MAQTARPTLKRVLQLHFQGYALREIGARFGKSHEWARKWVARGERWYRRGRTPADRRWYRALRRTRARSATEVACWLGCTRECIVRLARAEGIRPTHERPTACFFSPRAVAELRRKGFVAKPCVVCDRRFLHLRTQHRVTCGTPCARRWQTELTFRRRGRRASYRRTIPPEALTGWMRALSEYRRTHPLPRTSLHWDTVGKAVRGSALTTLQLYLLADRGLVSTRPHPEPRRRWHGGRRIRQFCLEHVIIADQFWRVEKVRRDGKAP